MEELAEQARNTDLRDGCREHAGCCGIRTDVTGIQFHDECDFDRPVRAGHRQKRVREQGSNGQSDLLHQGPGWAHDETPLAAQTPPIPPEFERRRSLRPYQRELMGPKTC